MLRGKLSASLITAVLVATVLPALSSAPAQAAPERMLASKTYVGTRSAAGFPASSVPGRQLARAALTIHYDTASGEPSLEVKIALKDFSENGGQLQYGVGRVTANGVCDLTHGDSRNTWASDREYSDWLAVPAGIAFNCASAQVVFGTTVTDRMGGPLANHYIQPRLTVSRPRVLDRAQKQVRLVRRVAQPHQFVVRNAGQYRARNVVVTARGKGMKTVRRNVGTIQPGKEATATVPLRLVSKAKRTAVRITVSGSGVSAKRTVKVRAVKAPARPAAGKWRSTNKTFTFRVKKGRITAFRGINMRMTCGGGFGGFPTYRNVSLSFPKVKVPRHGYVDAIKKYRKGDVWYTATLRGRVVGKKMTQARFTYSTAGSCRVSEGFTARRR